MYFLDFTSLEGFYRKERVPSSAVSSIMLYNGITVHVKLVDGRTKNAIIGKSKSEDDAKKAEVVYDRLMDAILQIEAAQHQPQVIAPPTPGMFSEVTVTPLQPEDFVIDVAKIVKEVEADYE